MVMKRVAQLPDLLPSAEVRVYPVIIYYPVTVIVCSIADSRSIVPYSLKHRRKPDGADSHVLQIIQFLNEPRDVTSPEAAIFHLRITVARETIHRISGIRILWIHVGIVRVVRMKTVDEGEVDSPASIITAFVRTPILDVVSTSALDGSRA